MSEMNDTHNTTMEDEEYFCLEDYRKIVRNFINMRRYPTALFWAEKVAILSQNDPIDVYWYAQCMFLLSEYHRAAYIIKLNGLEKTNIPCYYLVVESLFEAKEYNEALEIMNSIDIEDLATSVLTTQINELDERNIWLDEGNKNEMLASIFYIKGRLFEALDNRTRAMDCYVQALQKSVYCTEAMDALVQHEMLMVWEENELMQHLSITHKCSDTNFKLIKKIYETKLKKYYDSVTPQVNAEQTPIGHFGSLKFFQDFTDKIKKNQSNEIKISNTITSKLITSLKTTTLSPANKIFQDLKNSPSYSLQSSLCRISSSNESNRIIDKTHEKKMRPICSNTISLSSGIIQIKQSVDIMAAEAEQLFYDCEYKKCIKLLDNLLKRDPYHNIALAIQIGCLVELNEINKLFYVAHKLVDLYPEKAVSWYAVGCYYDIIGKSDPARRYLSKATSLDRLYGPAWLAYGHSFAKENEHDQAMAAYFKATQLMRGSHLPLLYIGVECGLTKNLELAEKFFYQAMSIAPLDVFVLHELGVIKFEYEYYESAEEVLKTTAEIITCKSKLKQEAISARWQPLFNNLGHCCRKNKKYKEALEYHQLALLLKPQNDETCTAIGFVLALMGRLEEAIEYFHKSLSLNRDSVVTSTILKACIEDLMEENVTIDKQISKGKNSPKSSAKRPNIMTGTPMKLNCIKLKFDDYDASPNSDNTDNIYDVNMDI